MGRAFDPAPIELNFNERGQLQTEQPLTRTEPQLIRLTQRLAGPAIMAGPKDANGSLRAEGACQFCY